MKRLLSLAALVPLALVILVAVPLLSGFTEVQTSSQNSTSAGQGAVDQAVSSSQVMQSELITLNDATPSIDVVIDLPQTTTGTLSLSLSQAQVTLTDQAGNPVFIAADARLHALEFNLAPNSGSHTLTVERLPGVVEAYVQVGSLPGLTTSDAVTPVEGNVLSVNQSVSLALDSAQPGGLAIATLPLGAPSALTATFANANARTQLMDVRGQVIAQSVGGHVDGFTFVLDGGEYGLMLLGSGITDPVNVQVSAVPADASGFTLIDASAVSAAANTVTTSDTAGSSAASAAAETCQATVLVSAANLRSGPGTGYSVVDYGYRNDTLPVGGRNAENTWIVVGGPNGSAWMALDAARLSGDCANLTTFDIPLREAPSGQSVIAAPPQQSFGFEGEHEDSEHESGEHEGREFDDD